MQYGSPWSHTFVTWKRRTTSCWRGVWSDGMRAIAPPQQSIVCSHGGAVCSSQGLDYSLSRRSGKLSGKLVGEMTRNVSGPAVGRIDEALDRAV
jgi:hypothetical protein